MKACSGSSGTAPFIFNLCTRWRWVVNFTPQWLYPGERNPFYIKQEAGWPPEPVCTFWRKKNSLLLPSGSVWDGELFEYMSRYRLIKTLLYRVKVYILTILLNVENHLLRTATLCGQHSRVVPSFIITGVKLLQHIMKLRNALTSSISSDKSRTEITFDRLLPNSYVLIICPHYSKHVTPAVKEVSLIN
jgi:hypothetical protein